MPPDLALLSTFTSSNYPCLELIFMVPKVFKPLKFICTKRVEEGSNNSVNQKWHLLSFFGLRLLTPSGKHIGATLTSDSLCLSSYDMKVVTKNKA